MSNVYLEVENLKREVAGLENDVEELTNKNERLNEQMQAMESNFEKDAKNIATLSGRIQEIRRHKGNKPSAPSGFRTGIANGMVNGYINKVKEWFADLDYIVE